MLLQAASTLLRDEGPEASPCAASPRPDAPRGGLQPVRGKTAWSTLFREGFELLRAPSKPSRRPTTRSTTRARAAPTTTSCSPTPPTTPSCSAGRAGVRGVGGQLAIAPASFEVLIGLVRRATDAGRSRAIPSRSPRRSGRPCTASPASTCRRPSPPRRGSPPPRRDHRRPPPRLRPDRLTRPPGTAPTWASGWPPRSRSGHDERASGVARASTPARVQGRRAQRLRPPCRTGDPAGWAPVRPMSR
jgi:hypothetical protein